MFDIKNANHSVVEQMVENTLQKHPELLVWAGQGEEGLAKIQNWIFTQYSRTVEGIYAFMFAYGKVRPVIELLCEEEGLKFESVVKVLGSIAFAPLTLQGITGKFHYAYQDVSSDKVQKTVIALLKYGLVEVSSSSGYIITGRNYRLKDEQKKELEGFISNPPLLVKPDNNVFETYKALNRRCWTRKADGTKEIPWDFFNRQITQEYEIDYDTWFEFGVNEYPDVDFKEDKVQQQLDGIFRRHWRQDYLITLFHRLGIKRIYILWMFDHRGRVYPIGDVFNPQGTDIDKALLCFAPEPITVVGEYWLKISIANNHAENKLDKAPFELRMKFVEERVMPIVRQAKTLQEFMLGIMPECKKADSPVCFYAQCRNLWEIEQAKAKGETPMVYVITHWDHSQSMFQYLGAFAGDYETLDLTNTLGKKFHNLYLHFLKKMQADPSFGKLPDGSTYEYTYKEIKNGCIVPNSYGSVLSPIKTLKTENERNIYYREMRKNKAFVLAETLQKLWGVEINGHSLSTCLEYSFHLPDGFKVYKLMKGSKFHEEGEELDTVDYDYGEGTIIKVPVSVNKADEKSKECVTAIVHSVDAFDVRESVRACRFDPKKRKWLQCLLDNEELSRRLKISASALGLDAGDFLKRGLWIDDPTHPSVEKMKQLLAYAKDSGFASIRLLNEVTPQNVHLAPDLFRKLLRSLPEHSFQLATIHDSFGCLPNYTEELMDQKREIFVKICRSNLLTFILREFLKDPDLEMSCSGVLPEKTLERIREQGRVVS